MPGLADRLAVVKHATYTRGARDIRSLMIQAKGDKTPNWFYEKFYEAQYEELSEGYSYDYLLKLGSDKSIPDKSLIECASVALQNQAENFGYNPSNRLCRNYFEKNILTAKRSRRPNSMKFYYRVSGDWVRMYHVVLLSNYSVYDSFVNNKPAANWNEQDCAIHKCKRIFRNPVMDVWDKLDIVEVKLVVYKPRREAAMEMLFDGRNSTVKNWFSLDRLISSPWDDLTKGSGADFTMEEVRKMSFKIRKPGGPCSEEKGWMAVIQDRLYCPTIWPPANPFIYYSDNPTATRWSKLTYGEEFAIFIRQSSGMKPN